MRGELKDRYRDLSLLQGSASCFVMRIPTMKFFAGLLSIGCLALSLSASAIGAQTHPASAKPGHASPAARHVAVKVAPADEYFGRLKLSILGIRNTLKDLALKADYHPTTAESIFGSAAFAEDALREWEHKYPRDPWLAKTVAGLVHMYSKVPTPAGRAKMHAALAWLTSRYGSPRGLVAAASAEVTAADQVPVGSASSAALPADPATTVKH
ncbi:MAG: hypothetical protein NVS1B14_01560 [Vulcanimicrobiaceae bacterium]